MEHGRLPQTVEAITGGGGRHLLFRYANGATIKSQVGKLGPGIDVRGIGGYIVVEPSLHTSGKNYIWEVSSDPFDNPLAVAPDWLLDLLTPNTQTQGASKEVGDRIPVGIRNMVLTSLAGTMRRRGMTEPEILAALLEVNKGRCDPPLDESEVRKVARSISSKPSNTPIGGTGAFGPDDSCALASDGEPGSSGEPPRIWTIDELLDADFPPVEWIADGMLPKGGLILLHGAAESGKSIVATDLAIAVAAGRKWLETVDVLQGAVFYWDEENGAQRSTNRLVRMGATRGQPIHYIGMAGLLLTKPSDVKYVLDACISRSVKLPIIDTMIAAHELAEKDATEIRKLRAIFRPFLAAGITVLGIIHDRKDGHFTNVRLHEIAGSREFGAMADAAWQMKRTDAKSDEFRLECSKLRDGPRGETKIYRVEFIGAPDEPLRVTAAVDAGVAQVKRAQMRSRVLDALMRAWYQDDCWLTKKELELEIDGDHHTVKSGLDILLKETMMVKDAEEQKPVPIVLTRKRVKEEGQTGKSAMEYRLRDDYVARAETGDMPDEDGGE